MLLIVHDVSCFRLVAIRSFLVGFEAIYLCIAVLNAVVALPLQCVSIICEFLYSHCQILAVPARASVPLAWQLRRNL